MIRAIAGYVGMDFQTLTNGEYKLLLEPIAYVTFEGVRTAFTATEAAKYNQLRGGLLRKKMPSLSHKNACHVFGNIGFRISGVERL